MPTGAGHCEEDVGAGEGEGVGEGAAEAEAEGHGGYTFSTESSHVVHQQASAHPPQDS